MKAVALIINFFIPGLGSFFVGKAAQGILQIILYSIGIVLIFTGIGLFIGVPLCIAVWIWGLATALNSPSQPE
jgi:TM2 domain-containing membrane protein YozV